MKTKRNPANHGGSREGAGRKPTGRTTHSRSIRCTDRGWLWLQRMVRVQGFTSVGNWCDERSKAGGGRVRVGVMSNDPTDQRP